MQQHIGWWEYDNTIMTIKDLHGDVTVEVSTYWYSSKTLSPRLPMLGTRTPLKMSSAPANVIAK